MNGIELIAAERQRQMEVEGWTPDHDAMHTRGQLALAGACYAAYHNVRSTVLHLWPFEWCWWKPKDRVRNLVRAGALIAAEIDRLQAATPAEAGEGE